MTRKDYVLIAGAINDVWRRHYAAPVTAARVDSLAAIDNVIAKLTQEMRLTNPRFDADRFEHACRSND